MFKLFLERIFCRHRFFVTSWGHKEIKLKNDTVKYKNHVHVSCCKCGKIKRYEKDQEELPLSRKEMIVITKKLLGL